MCINWSNLIYCDALVSDKSQNHINKLLISVIFKQITETHPNDESAYRLLSMPSADVCMYSACNWKKKHFKLLSNIFLICTMLATKLYSQRMLFFYFSVDDEVEESSGSLSCSLPGWSPVFYWRYHHCLYQWFSTFLRWRHTFWEGKIGNTSRISKLQFSVNKC